MEFSQLIMAENLSAEQQEFKKVHFDILAKGGMAAECVLDMCKNLKEMRDKELYKQAGFATFEEYTEQALGIKKRQAYYYISIVTKLPDEFVQSNAQLGISKLALIASMSDQDREDMLAEHAEELQDMTVGDVEELKAGYEDRIKQLTIDVDAYKEDFASQLAKKDAELKKLLDEQTKSKAEMMNKLELDKKQTDKMAKQIEQQKAEIAELSQERVKAESVEKQLKQYKAEIEELSNASTKVETVEKVVNVRDVAAEERAKKLEEDLKNLESEYKAATAQNTMLARQLKMADATMAKFKVLFEQLQDTLAKISALRADAMDNTVIVKAMLALLDIEHETYATLFVGGGDNE